MPFCHPNRQKFLRDGHHRWPTCQANVRNARVTLSHGSTLPCLLQSPGQGACEGPTTLSSSVACATSAINRGRHRTASPRTTSSALTAEVAELHEQSVKVHDALRTAMATHTREMKEKEPTSKRSMASSSLPRRAWRSCATRRLVVPNRRGRRRS